MIWHIKRRRHRFSFFYSVLRWSPVGEEEKAVHRAVEIPFISPRLNHWPLWLSPSTDRHAVLRATPPCRSVHRQPSSMSAFVLESVCVLSQGGSQFSDSALRRHNQELSCYDNEEILWFGSSAVFRGCVYTCRMHVSLQYMDSAWPLCDKWSGFTVWLYYIILQCSASSDCCNVLSFSPLKTINCIFHEKVLWRRVVRTNFRKDLPFLKDTYAQQFLSANWTHKHSYWFRHWFIFYYVLSSVLGL